MIIRAFISLAIFLGATSMALSMTVLEALQDQNVRTLTIYSSLDENLSQPLLEAYQDKNPNIRIHFHDLQSLEIYERTIAETDTDNQTADILISSAMDLQVKLANDGYAQRSNVVAPSWPDWAIWQRSVFGLTFEPSVIVYHKPSFDTLDVPLNRGQLSQLLTDSADEFYQRIGTYDIERSGLGFLFLARDAEHSRDIWQLVGAMGAAGVKLYSSSSSILERVVDGRLALGYNILGSYANGWTENHPNLGIIMPEDYTVVMSRTALIPSAAVEPELGKDFLNYLMSLEGQTIMANELKLAVLHPDVEGPNTVSQFRETFGARLQPVPIGPGLVVYLDQVKRARFIERWNQTLRGE